MAPTGRNGSSQKPKGNDDSDVVTIRINKKLLFGAACALFGALSVVVIQKLFNVASTPAAVEPSASASEASHPASHVSLNANRLELERIRWEQARNAFKHPAYNEEEEHPDKDIRRIPSDLSNWPYGALGLGVDLDLALLSEDEVSRKQEMYQSHAFEEFVSEMIPLNRSLPDFRHRWCKSTYDHLAKDLRPVSVIICFHNEAWSTLLRSVHSVINRSPARLVTEILLVDDASTMEHLGGRLERYVEETFPKGVVKVVRQRERSGLMRSRMVGIRAARKDTVLLFLDSHVEVTAGWLEPLLARIGENPKVIISPQIDHISDSTLHYKYVPKDLIGLINWNLGFEWHELAAEEKRKKPNPHAPHSSPVMAGGLFAVEREFFDRIGFYDEGMEIWGSENLELSFKAWMCGGRIEISPCSHVGHIFRSWSPYDVREKEINRNKIRAAEVWMDDFKYLFYHRLGKSDGTLEARLGDYGDVAERKELRRNLKCRSFKWYLDTVATGLPYHPLIGAGHVMNPARDVCIDKDDQATLMDQPVDLISCHRSNGFQYWWMNENGYWLRDYLCVGVSDADGETVIVKHCGKSGGWTYDPQTKRLKHSVSGKCLAVATSQAAVVRKCSNGADETQEWIVGQYNRRGLKYNGLL